ncbi:MAG: hypothetical protein HKP48_09785 [Winogradskyella sp.]|uniref:hypothetical protein n=1 Tax=Winogradskyella sp. TaxID=1883156 RepID=UPI00181BBB16|nr:hypothetical protein [Winogradskyella sp.]MBT8245635.1 hypothetical protein [Winogradskyella sp.]NNK23557.1 hypothetical protein [Winogradskyella sp.]
MKNSLLTLFLFSCTFIYSQTLTFDEVSKAEKKKEIKSKFSEYKAENGEVFKVGESITIGSPSSNSENYQFIIETDGWTSSQRAGLGARDYNAEIIKFKITGTKRAGYEVMAVCKTKGGVFRYWINIESAIKNGEIITSQLSRAEAITKLKEAKDLLDLEMMTQEEYDKLKKELEPIIRGKN